MNNGRSSPSAPPSPAMLRAPAIQALLIQAISFAFVLMLAYGLPALMEMQITVAVAALLQGSVAAAISRWRAMAPWWLVIQLLFPAGLIALHAFRLPPWIFLAAFAALLALFWTTYRTQVPYYPSTPATWKAVEALLPQGQTLRFIDIGSGFGGLVMHLAECRPDGNFSGVEVAPLPWLASALRAHVKRSNACFTRGDYHHLDFADYDVVFAYLSPAAMPGLWRKANAEMRPGTLLLSYEFPIPGIDPDIVYQTVEGVADLYGWRI